MTIITASAKADTALGFFFFLHELVDGLKDNFKLSVILLFHGHDFLHQASLRGGELAHADESTYDFDVDLDSLLAVQDALEHGDALLSKYPRKFTPTTAAGFIGK